jgi:hypothetical protein
MLQRRSALLLAGAFVMGSRTARAADDAGAILRESDTARGGGLAGIVWNLHLTTTGNDDATDGDRDMLVKANQDASVAETLAPVRFRSTKLLQVGRNMWLSRPGLQKPIPISPRQRLSGLAANGDIAATNYAADYTPTLVRDEPVGNEVCAVLELVAKSRYSTYDRIVYWVSRDRKLGVKAEFRAVSGKPLKSATFEYGNTISVAGQPRPFVSRMTITDALSPAKTVLDYTDIQVQTIPASTFDVGNLL